MPFERRWFKIAEVAPQLGVSKWSLYRLAAKKQIPVARLEGLGLLVDMKALTARLERATVKPRDSRLIRRRPR